MNTSRKFTDADVYDDPGLVAIAEEYVLNYVGDFAFMRSCQAMVRRRGAMTIPMVRGVLNCMLNDPNISDDDMPKPKPMVVTLPRPAMPKSRPSRIYVKVRWKRRYVLSMHKAATVAHIIHPASRLAFYPAVNKYSWELRLWCGVNLRERNAEMRDTPQGRKVCNKCKTYEREGVNPYVKFPRAR